MRSRECTFVGNWIGVGDGSNLKREERERLPTVDTAEGKYPDPGPSEKEHGEPRPRQGEI